MCPGMSRLQVKERGGQADNAQNRPDGTLKRIGIRTLSNRCAVYEARLFKQRVIYTTSTLKFAWKKPC